MKYSDLNFDVCHPILLPRNHDLTRKIIREENIFATCTPERRLPDNDFGRYHYVARKVIQECVICFKAKPRQSEALMGSLPASRVKVSRPFAHCGVDYAGPVVLREGKRRNARNHTRHI